MYETKEYSLSPVQVDAGKSSMGSEQMRKIFTVLSSHTLLPSLRF